MIQKLCGLFEVITNFSEVSSCIHVLFSFILQAITQDVLWKVRFIFHLHDASSILWHSEARTRDWGSPGNSWLTMYLNDFFLFYDFRFESLEFSQNWFHWCKQATKCFNSIKCYITSLSQQQSSIYSLKKYSMPVRFQSIVFDQGELIMTENK
jgi:hypothetical protein